MLPSAQLAHVRPGAVRPRALAVVVVETDLNPIIGDRFHLAFALSFSFAAVADPAVEQSQLRLGLLLGGRRLGFRLGLFLRLCGLLLLRLRKAIALLLLGRWLARIRLLDFRVALKPPPRGPPQDLGQSTPGTKAG